MPVFNPNPTPEDEQLIDPPVGSTENNIDDSADATDTPPVTVVTETKVTSKEVVVSDESWVDTAATDDPNSRYDVSGSPWSVDYYRQLLDGDDVTDVVSEYVPGPQQEYLLFKNYTLWVQTDLTSGTGEAVVLDTFVPTIGDHIVANLGDGRKGLIKVESVDTTSRYLGRAYTITYTIIAYTDEDFLVLDSKVVKTFYYDERLAKLTRKSALTSDELVAFRRQLEQLSNLEREWVSTFYNREVQSFTYTDATSEIYHPLLSEFVEKTFTGPLLPVRRYYDFDVDSIYKAVIERRLPTLTQFEGVKVVEVTKLQALPRLNAVAYTSVSHVMFVDASQDTILKAWGYEFETIKETLNDMFSVSSVGSPQPWIPNLSTVTGHLFDTDWVKSESLSVLEELLKAWLTYIPVNEDKLSLLMEQYQSFTLGEKFCYGPFIFFLARVRGK